MGACAGLAHPPPHLIWSDGKGPRYRENLRNSRSPCPGVEQPQDSSPGRRPAREGSPGRRLDRVLPSRRKSRGSRSVLPRPTRFQVVPLSPRPSPREPCPARSWLPSFLNVRKPLCGASPVGAVWQPENRLGGNQGDQVSKVTVVGRVDAWLCSPT